MRVYLDAQSFKTVSVDLTTTVEQLIRMMSKKLFKVDTSLYRIVETKNNKGACGGALRNSWRISLADSSIHPSVRSSIHRWRDVQKRWCSVCRR